MRFARGLDKAELEISGCHFFSKASFIGDSSFLVRSLSIAIGKCWEKFLTFLGVFISEHMHKKFDDLWCVLHKILIPVLEEIG